jgi:hypothetical protein
MIVGKAMDDIYTFSTEALRTESTDVKEAGKACPHSLNTKPSLIFLASKPPNVAG